MLVRLNLFLAVFTIFILVAVLAIPKKVNSQAMPISDVKEQALSDFIKTQQPLQGLAERGEADDRKILFRLYDQLRNVDVASYNADIHAAAAYKVMKMTRRLEKNQADDS